MYAVWRWQAQQQASKMQNSPLTQTRPESVFAHGAEAKRKKKQWVLFTLWTQLCVFSHSSWNFHTKKPPKTNTSGNPNSIWSIFSRKRKEVFCSSFMNCEGVVSFPTQTYLNLFIYLYIYLTLNTVTRYSTRVYSLPIWLILKQSSCIFWICLFLLGLT